MAAPLDLNHDLKLNYEKEPTMRSLDHEFGMMMSGRRPVAPFMFYEAGGKNLYKKIVQHESSYKSVPVSGIEFQYVSMHKKLLNKKEELASYIGDPLVGCSDDTMNTLIEARKAHLNLQYGSQYTSQYVLSETELNEIRRNPKKLTRAGMQLTKCDAYQKLQTLDAWIAQLESVVQRVNRSQVTSFIPSRVNVGRKRSKEAHEDTETKVVDSNPFVGMNFGPSSRGVKRRGKRKTLSESEVSHAYNAATIERDTRIVPHPIFDNEKFRDLFEYTETIRTGNDAVTQSMLDEASDELSDLDAYEGGASQIAIKYDIALEDSDITPHNMPTPRLIQQRRVDSVVLGRPDSDVDREVQLCLSFQLIKRRLAPILHNTRQTYEEISMRLGVSHLVRLPLDDTSQDHTLPRSGLADLFLQTREKLKQIEYDSKYVNDALSALLCDSMTYEADVSDTDPDAKLDPNDIVTEDPYYPEPDFYVVDPHLYFPEEGDEGYDGATMDDAIDLTFDDDAVIPDDDVKPDFFDLT